jgi:hypothetical protein
MSFIHFFSSQVSISHRGLNIFGPIFIRVFTYYDKVMIIKVIDLYLNSFLHHLLKWISIENIVLDLPRHTSKILSKEIFLFLQ